MAAETEDGEGLKCPRGALGWHGGAGDTALQRLVLRLPKPGTDPQELGRGGGGGVGMECGWVVTAGRQELQALLTRPVCASRGAGGQRGLPVADGSCQRHPERGRAGKESWGWVLGGGWKWRPRACGERDECTRGEVWGPRGGEYPPSPLPQSGLRKMGRPAWLGSVEGQGEGRDGGGRVCGGSSPCGLLGNSWARLRALLHPLVSHPQDTITWTWQGPGA